ncbi:MAG: hypothetical protein H2174_01695 [Vampirovibrio sp.]|nr:hypothetical protein [Vampirovibrio sp.]
MSKRSKTTVSRQVRKVSSASYKAYYGITLIETLMSVGLLGVVLLPLLMTSTAYLSTKLLNNRTNSELSQNVNALGAKLHTLTASTTGVNHLTSTTNNLEMRIKTSTGARRIFHYSIIGAPGAQRLREFQGSTGNFTSTAAMRSLNEDSITLVGNTGFVYCNDTTCTVPTNTAAQNQAIARTAEMVVFDGNTATNVVRVGSGVVTGAEPVGLLFNAGDNSRKKTFLPSNTLTLGTDPILANGGGGTILPNPAIATNTDPEGLINVFTKAQVYGTPMGGRAVDADLRLATGSDSSFTALPLANVVPPIPPALPVAPSTTQTTRTDFSRIYREGPGTAATGNVRTILPNFQLDQTVADSFQGNMCFSGTQQVQGFQVYYWNRTMKQAALTSVQSADTVADPFTVTPECAGASSGYNNDANSGSYYINTYPRNQWQAPITTTKIAPDSYTKQTAFDYLRYMDAFGGTPTLDRYIYPNFYPNKKMDTLFDPNKAQYYQWHAWAYGDAGYNGYYYTSGKALYRGSNGTDAYEGFKFNYYTANGLGSKTVPVFDPPPTSIGVVNDHELTMADEVGQDQAQKQTIVPNGLHVLVHKAGDDAPLSASVNDIDPLGGNNQSNIYNRGLKEFAIFGTEGLSASYAKEVYFSKNSCGDSSYTPWLALIVPTIRDNVEISSWADFDICTPLYNNNVHGVYPSVNNDKWWKSDPKNTTVTVIEDVPFNIKKVGLFPLKKLTIKGKLERQSSNKFYVNSLTALTNIPDVQVSWTYPLPNNILPNSWAIWSSNPYYLDKAKPFKIFDNDYGTVPIIQVNSRYFLELNNSTEPNPVNPSSWNAQPCELIADDGSFDSPNESVTCNFISTGLEPWRYSDDYTQYNIEFKEQGLTKKKFLSQRNTFIRSDWATVPVKKYVNPTPIAGADTINADSFSRPYVIRDNSENYLFYNLIKTNGLNRTNQLYSFNPTNQQVVAGPVVNLYWGDVATLRLAQGKRVLSYSPHNKVAVTGNTSTYGNVYAWYYDRVDQPVATLKTGGVGFNSAQANNANANYIADPTSTLNAYQTNLTAVTSEGSTLYTLNSVTGTLTRYVTRLGQYNHVRQSETKLTSGIVNASSAIAVSPMDDGLYLLDAANRTVRYYADRRMGDVATTTSVATLGAKLGSTAGAYAKILSNNMRDFEALLDTSSNPPPFDDVASFGELQACITSCTNPSVNEAAQYFVNNKATVFTPMESISDPVPNDIFHVNDLNAYVTQQNTGGLSATQTTVTIPTQGVARSFTTPQATTPTGLAVSKATGLVYVLDSTLGTVTVGTTVTRTLNIHVYNPNGTFIETLALNVSDDQFVNDDDRLVPQSGQIMRLTLDEKKSQFYVHVENNGRTYQFGVDRQI